MSSLLSEGKGRPLARPLSAATIATLLFARLRRFQTERKSFGACRPWIADGARIKPQERRRRSNMCHGFIQRELGGFRNLHRYVLAACQPPLTSTRVSKTPMQD